MRKKLLFVSAMMVSLLVSCGGNPSDSSSSLTPSSNSTVSSESSKESSVVSSNESSAAASSSESIAVSSAVSSSIESSSQKELNWTEQDKTDMHKAFENDLVLPFPSDFSENYVNDSMEYDGTFFFSVHDSTISSLDYGPQLLEDGFQDDTEYYIGLEEGEKVYSYHYSEQYGFMIIDTYYDSTYKCFCIDGYYDTDDGYYQTSSFPYSIIEDFFDLTEVSKTLPEIKSTSNIYKTILDSSAMNILIDEAEDTVGEYKAKLEANNFTIETSESGTPIATSTELGLQVMFFSSGTDIYLYITSLPKEGENNISITSSLFGTGYPTEEATITIPDTSYILKYYTIMRNSDDEIQLSKYSEEKGRDAYIYNTTSFTEITKFSLAVSDAQYFGTPVLYLGLTSDSVTVKCEGSMDAANTTYSYTIPTDAKYGYFKLANESTQYAVRLTSIDITFVI